MGGGPGHNVPSLPCPKSCPAAQQTINNNSHAHCWSKDVRGRWQAKAKPHSLGPGRRPGAIRKKIDFYENENRSGSNDSF